MSGGEGIRVRRRRAARGLALAALLAVPVVAAAIEIDWYTLDAGGGTSASAGLSVTGTIGQPDAGPLAGGPFALRGGFWASPGPAATDAPAGSQVAVPTAHRLSMSAPNPFRDRTALRFDLPRRERARIRVYDVTGRLVSTLVDRDLDPGTHEAAWDGRDAGGQRVASGVYLVRMQAGNFGATRKIVRLD